MEVYDCLYKMNVECEFIWPQQKERLKDYEIIVIPALYSASQELIDALDHYIKERGHAFMTFKSAFTDEHIKVWHDEAPHGLAKAFGISYSHFTWPHGVGLRFEGPDITGDNKEVRDFMELLEPDGAKVLISYDHKSFSRYAALTRNSYGKGSATYLGCNVSEDVLRQILSDTVKDAGIELNENSVFPLIHRKGRNNMGKMIHYFMNYSGEELRFTPGMSGTELISGEDTDDKKKLTLAAWDLAIIEEG